MNSNVERSEAHPITLKDVHNLAIGMRAFANHMCHLVINEKHEDFTFMLMFLEFDLRPTDTNHFYLYLDEKILGYLAWPTVVENADLLGRTKVGTNVLLLAEGYQIGEFLEQPTFHETCIKELQNVTSLTGCVLSLADFARRKFPLLSSSDVEQLRQGLDPREESAVGRERRSLDDLFMLAEQGIDAENALFSAGAWRRHTDPVEEEEGDDDDEEEDDEEEDVVNGANGNGLSGSGGLFRPHQQITRDASGRFSTKGAG